MMMMIMMEDDHDQDQAVVCKDDQLQIIKGKRSKRPRQPSPLSLVMGSSTTTPTTMTSSDDSRGFGSSPTTSVELSKSTEEDEDMANCLILLARGDQTRNLPPQPVSMVVHQCKTCNRCFPSFQALGGHRASHKKPKVVNNDESNKGLMFVKEDVLLNNMNTTLSLQVTNKQPVLGHKSKVPKVHECTMCGAEFSSGQALGGHMRRHRTLTNVATTTTRPKLSEDKSKKQRTVLQLDLNLPAPEDHDHHQRETKFSFASKQENLLLFSASSLVDCHY